MKVDIYLNNILPRYNRSPVDPSSAEHISLKHVKRLLKSNEDHLFILRGEPTLYPYLYELLDALQGKQFIVITSGFEPEKLIRYPKKIPYLVLNYDGFLNDKIRNNPSLTRNTLKLLDHFGNNMNMTTRIQYTISKHNLGWMKADAEIIIKMYDQYPNLKKPYFVVYQQTEVYNEEVFTWVGIGKETVSLLNHKGLLSQKNLSYLNAWLNKEEYKCISPQKEMVLSWDGTFRTCQSMRFGEIIANIEDDTFDEIIETTKPMREDCLECAFRQQCWLSFHYKDNIAEKKGLL